MRPARPSCAPTDYDLLGLPLVWHPGLVFVRIRRLYLGAFTNRTVTDIRGWGTLEARNIPESVMAYARECGITWATTWRSSHRSRPLIVCPRCQALAWRLVEDERGAWTCRRCVPWPGSRTERLLAEYQFGVRIGLRHAIMNARAKRLAIRLRDGALRAKTPAQLVLLAQGAELIGRNAKKHNRRGMRDFGGTPTAEQRKHPTPVWTSASPHLISAMIDSLLHPIAYQARYGSTRRAA